MTIVEGNLNVSSIHAVSVVDVSSIYMGNEEVYVSGCPIDLLIWGVDIGAQRPQFSSSSSVSLMAAAAASSSSTIPARRWTDLLAPPF